MENYGHSGTQKPQADVDQLAKSPDLVPYFKKFKKFYQELARKDKPESKEEEKVFKELSSLFIDNFSPEEFPTRFLSLGPFKHYQSCHIFLQEKGQTTALHYLSKQEKGELVSTLQAQHFNKMFSLIKKSKNKFFHQNLVPQIDLKLVGSFLANAFTLKSHNLILIISRHDFLTPEVFEIKTFDIYSELLPSFLEKSLNQTQVESKKRHIINSLQNYPLPLLIQNAQKEILLKHPNASGELKEEYKLSQDYTLQIFQSDKEDASSELFHHQRVSLLGELLNTLRHELNNPLFGLKLTSDLLVHEAMDEEQASILKEIAINVTRSQNIMENFTNLYTKTDVYEECSLKKVLDEALTIAKSEIRQVKVCQFYQGDINPEFKIYTNPTSMVQIFFNLIVNSSQAMRQAKVNGATIVFNFKKLKDSMQIEMSDNGPGIPKEIETKLFEPFFTTKPNGTGLGLSITMSLVKHLKGQIEYLRNENGGATFLMTFPLEAP